MKKMLVLLNLPKDIEDHLSELREMVIEHEIGKVYLARLSRAFSSRAHSVVGSHKLDMAARMSDTSASKYLSKMADDLRTEDLDVEPISTGILAMEINEFLKKNEIYVTVTKDLRSGLCCWLGTGFSERQVLFFCEHVFRRMQPTLPEQSNRAKTRG